MKSEEPEDADGVSGELVCNGLLRFIAKKVSSLAARLDLVSIDAPADEQAKQGIINFEPLGPPSQVEELSQRRRTRAIRPPLPDPRLVREIIRKRQLRTRHFGSDIFADPA